MFYWPLRAFSRGLFDEIPALPSAHVDIVPVDYVADALVCLLDGDAEGVFNLVSGREAPFANELVELACDRFDRPRPTVVGAPGERRRARRRLPAVLDMDVVFDDSRARALLEPAGIRLPDWPTTSAG